MHRTARPFAAAALVAGLAFGGVACGDDEDDDGAVIDEEVGELDQNIDEGADELEQELEEGEAEVEGEEG